jgi:hypothetical protein
MKKLDPGQCLYTPDVIDFDKLNIPITMIKCGVCEEYCSYNGKFKGPRGFIANMFRTMNNKDDYPSYYSFTCPNLKEDWHEHVEKLYSDLYKCNSYVIKNLLQREISATIDQKRILKSLDISCILSVNE